MNNEIFKYIAIGAASIYIYKKFINDPYSLGSRQSIENKAYGMLDRALGSMNLNPKIKNYVEIGAKNFIKNELDGKMNLKDVTPKE